MNIYTRRLHEDSEIIRLQRPGGGSFVVNRSERTWLGERDRVVFWYDLDGRRVAGRLEAKARMTWDALARGRTNGALVLVGSRVFGPEDDANLNADLEDFVKRIDRILPEFLEGGPKS